MKIATWNLNSIRARQQRLISWLASAQPDVVCLQELKCTDAEFPTDALREAGYHSASFGQKTYNGVALLAKSEITDVVRGHLDGVEDSHARLIAGTVNGVRIVSAYAPNGQEVDSPAYQYKLEWYRRLRKVLDERHKVSEPLVLCGDWNVAPEDIDVYDPAGWKEQTLCSTREREALKGVVDFGLVDTFRKHSQEPGKYSWWDYRMLAFPKNKGLRIDHVYATPKLAEACTAAGIDREQRKGQQPSDHAPVWAEFAL